MNITAYHMHRDSAAYHDSKSHGFIQRALQAATHARAEALIKFAEMHRSMAEAARDKARSFL